MAYIWTWISVANTQSSLLRRREKVLDNERREKRGHHFEYGKEGA
jgi:hypothetical protein